MFTLHARGAHGQLELCGARIIVECPKRMGFKL